MRQLRLWLCRTRNVCRLDYHNVVINSGVPEFPTAWHTQDNNNSLVYVYIWRRFWTYNSDSTSSFLRSEEIEQCDVLLTTISLGKKQIWQGNLVHILPDRLSHVYTYCIVHFVMADSSSISLIIIFVGVLLFVVTAFVLCCVLCRLRSRSPGSQQLQKNRSKNDSQSNERETTNVTEF